MKLMQEVTGKANVKLCIKTFGMCYESSHGFLRIISLIDGKSYFRYVLFFSFRALPFKSIVKFFIIRNKTDKNNFLNKESYKWLQL